MDESTLNAQTAFSCLPPDKNSATDGDCVAGHQTRGCRAEVGRNVRWQGVPLREHEGLCINLNGRIHREEGLVFCGMNRVRDYPFGYKHWCARDGDFIACPQQFCGEGLEMDEHGGFVPLNNLVAYLSAKPSIGDELDRLKAQLRPGEMERSIWMVHQPPTGMGMDICGDGRQVGSPTVLKFIEDNQPLLGCSGHIHESPYQPGGRWMAQVGRTVWVQPGQMGHRLHYASVEIGDGHEVTNVRHGIFGPAAPEI